MNPIVKKYYDKLIRSMMDYGVAFLRHESYYDEITSMYIPIVDTFIGDGYFMAILGGNTPRENLDIVLQVLSIFLRKKIKTIYDVEKNQLNKNGDLVIHFDPYSKRILIISENMEKNKIFPNHDYEEEGDPILLINQVGIKSLGKMKKIDFNLWIGRNLEKFGGLEIVKGKIIMSRNTIKSFDTLKEVDEINLNDGDINSLGSLEIIHGNCRLGSNLESLGNLKFVGGDILIQSKKITTLGNLEKVGNRLRIRKTLLLDLGKLHKVGGEVLISRDVSESVLHQLHQRGFKSKKG